MKDDNNWLEQGLKYADTLDGQENLSPNELKIIALAKEVKRLRSEVKAAKRSRG